MKRKLIAFLASLLIHCLILLALFVRFKGDENKFIPPKHGSKEGERISIRDFKFLPPSRTEPQAQTSQQSPQQPTQSPQAKQPVKSEQPKQTPKKPSKEPSKPKPAPKQSPQQPTQSPQKSSPKKSSGPSIQQYSPPSPSYSPSSPSIYDYSKNMANQNIKELYGEEFYSLNTEEKRFIQNNLSRIGEITQRYLKYPPVAGRIGQQGDNIVEFYLHPNGDISDLKLIHSSGFELLDDNSRHTIEIAYKDYPYPSVKTKIRIRVMYRIY